MSTGRSSAQWRWISNATCRLFATISVSTASARPGRHILARPIPASPSPSTSVIAGARRSRRSLPYFMTCSRSASKRRWRSTSLSRFQVLAPFCAPCGRTPDSSWQLPPALGGDRQRSSLPLPRSISPVLCSPARTMPLIAARSCAKRWSSCAVKGSDPIETRPGFAAMLEAIEANGTQTIIVETANRFARDLMVQEVGYAMLKGRGIDLIAADSPQSFLDDTPTARLIRQVLGAVSEFEKAMLVAKLRGARERKRRTGVRVEGRKSLVEREGGAELLNLTRKLAR